MKKIAFAAAMVVALFGCASYRSTIYGPIGDTNGKKVSAETPSLNTPSDIEETIKKLSEQCPSKEVVNFYSTWKHTNYYFFESNHYYFAGNCKQ